MYRITFLTGTFILGLMATEKANATMEVSPSPKPAVREEREMSLESPWKKSFQIHLFWI